MFSETKLDIAVIGGGASGLFVAGFLSEAGHHVVVFDKNEKVGKKLYITGKGRCNLTNLCPSDDFLKNVVRGEKFLRSAIYNFSSQDAVDFFEGLGLRTKVERGQRVFPQSDKSSDVIRVLQKVHCKGVDFRLDEEVLDVKSTSDSFCVRTAVAEHKFDRVIVATGGKSYRTTGSDGKGYEIARAFGHDVVPLVPALCPIRLNDVFVKKLQGVSLKNVTLSALADGKKLEFFGEMLFTEDGISGPIVLSLSSVVNRAKSVQLWLDFKPALDEKQLDARLLRDFDSAKNKDVLAVFRGLLPKSVAEVFCSVCGLDGRKVNGITKEEREKIAKLLKHFPLTFGGLYDLNAGIVTSGGVSLDEVNPKTFESKLQKGLYFVGEVLDVDAFTGGFNLQIAWATAFMCAKHLE